jgi:molecular chaperone DnaK
MSTLPDLVVGIDLGTTNSAIAAVIDGAVTVIPVAGQSSMPSAVGLDPAGRIIIGQAAKNQSVSAPENTLLSIKRLMGTEETVELGDRHYRPEEVSALILGELKRAAEAHLGCAVSHAVITVPAFFNERQRQATQDAGRLAGLEVLRIINEPTAAALAYGAGSGGQDSDDERETLLVYDLGGGTFDVSLVTVEKGVVEVRSSHGDTHLGGDDFDELLAQLGEKRIREALGGQDQAPLPPATGRRLKAVMEKAKILLSDQPYANVREEYLTESFHLDTELSREEYEKQIEPLLEKTLECLQRTLADAQVTAAEVDKIMLVGGATRTPRVHELLRHRLGKQPHHEINPDLIVAMGAAIQGAALAGQPAPAILIDITAHTYSMLALTEDPYGGPFNVRGCVPLIRRGTPMPVRKGQSFVTIHDDQEAIDVQVYQGEAFEQENNLQIGNFHIKGLAKVPKGNEVIVEFQIDLNGLLTVTATEKRTGLVKSVTIDTAGHHRLNLDAARTHLAALFDDGDDEDESYFDEDGDEEGGHAGEDSDMEAEAEVIPADADSPVAAPSGLVATAKSLRRRSEALLERGVAEKDAANIRTQLDMLSIGIQQRNWAQVEKMTDALSDLLFYLED